MESTEEGELNMTYEIIKNSESYTGFNIPDKEYKGQIDGLCCGWSFEFQNDKGEYDYNSVAWYEGTPEEYCQTWLQYGEEDKVVWSGWSEDIPDEYEGVEINTWNCIPKKYTGGICFNID